MKRFLLVLTTLFLCVLCAAQQKNARVTLKNGTVLSGELVELDPLSHLVLKVAGLSTRIGMDQVAAVETDSPAREAEVSTAEETLSEPEPEPKAEPEATPEYKPFHRSAAVPDSFSIQVGNTRVEMVLVRGGVFQMGYNGRGSGSYASAPIHSVRLSDYYVSKEPVTLEQARVILGKKLINARVLNKHYAPTSWDQAHTLAGSLAKTSGLPVRMITEAEWEYLAASGRAPSIKTFKEESEWCLDFFGKYPVNAQSLQDPTGPAQGDAHVVRGWYSAGNEKYKRVSAAPGTFVPATVRIVLPASEYKKEK